MDKTNLPPLPEPGVKYHQPDSFYQHGGTRHAYTAEQMHEYAARAVREAVPDGMVLVRKEAIDWLNGESDFECPPDRYFRGKPPAYWWRSVFREKAGLAAAPTHDQEPTP